MEAYRLTKTIRFKLEPIHGALTTEVKALDQTFDNAAGIAELHELATKLANGIEAYLFKKTDIIDTNETSDQLPILNHQIEIKKSWLKQYTKEHYYNWSSEKWQARTHRITSVTYLREVLYDWNNNWCNLNQKLKALIERPEENQARRAEFALLIAEFNKRDNFRFILDFINSSQDKTDDTEKNELINLATDIEVSLANCEKQYLPDQSIGLVIARASLNYYTINKKPRNYTHEIMDKRQLLNSKVEKTSQAITQKIGKKGFENQIRYFILKHIFKSDDIPLTLDSLYQQLKIYKAQEKKRFEESVDQGINYHNIQQNHPLFNSNESDFNSYVEKTNEIKKIGSAIAKLDKSNSDYLIKRKELSQNISKLKQQRGKDFFFIGKGKNNGAKEYKKFCELYKHIAMKRGRTLAEIKGIEREKIDSQLLNYWALILENNHQHQLVLVPKEKAQAAYQKLEREHDKSGLPITLHYFKSLTLRSLKKLCFGTQGNTFAREIRIELEKEHQNKYDQIQGAFSLAEFESEKEIVQFYQSVLNTGFVENNLDIDDFEDLETLVNNQRICTLIEFETELEKICYRKRILAGNELKIWLHKECGAQFMAITSYDLTKDKSRKGKDKQHTKIWKKFWSNDNQKNDYPVRLNPELKIIWRKAKESRVKKYGKESNNYNPDKNNRYLNPQFTLAITITENALGKRLDLAFVDQETLADKIQEFNDDFNNNYASKPNAIYFYGIDRGNAELASLALVSRFTEKKNEFNQPIAEFARFKVYRLKDDCLDYQEEYHCKGQPKQRKAISNLSYFIDNSDLFETTEKSSIDLTTAKLIKGKIIENGDVLSYLRLKELSAKRRIYEYFSQSNIDHKKSSVIYFKDNNFCIRTNDNNHHAIIYYYRPDLEKVRSRVSIKNMLTAYLELLKERNQERDILTIEKINHLRDAMAANMVGIIAHLYEQYPGIIALENLTKDELASHFLASNENISRRLELKLYNKFQNFGLVPPRLKESILLRQDKQINQFGLVHFISAEHTSKNCPYCGEKNSKSRQEWELDKYENRIFDYTNQECGFNTNTNQKGMDSLNNPDMVASYNIAKRGFEYLINPLSIMKRSQEKNNRYIRHTTNEIDKSQRAKSNKQAAPINCPFADLKNMLKKG